MTGLLRSVILVFFVLARTSVEAGEVEKNLSGVKKGMTQAQVQSLLGKPAEIKRREACWGVEERWVYHGLEGKSLLFVDEKFDRVEPAR
jgi:hypothetical protein